MSRIPRILVCLGAALSALTTAPALRAADLSEAVHQALESDPVFGSVRAGQDATAELTPQARAALLPNASVAMAEGATRIDLRVPGSPVFAKTFNSWGPSINLNIPVFSAPLWDSFDQAKLTVQAGEIQVLSARSDLYLRTAQAYFDVLAAQDALTAVEKNELAILEQLKAARREYELGNKTVVDTDEAQARYNEATAQEEGARGTLLIRQRALRAIVGQEVTALFPLKDELHLELPVPGTAQAWTQRAEDESHPVTGARLNVEIARQQVQAARDAYLPTVSIAGSMQYQKADNYSIYLPVTTATTQSTLGIQLTAPIFTGGAIQSRVREAKARLAKAELDLELARRTASQNAYQAFVGSSSGLAQVEALESTLRSAHVQLESTRLGYKVGVRINLDVLNATTLVLNTERDLKKARYDFLMSGLRLKAAVGSLLDEDIAEVNHLLQHGPLPAGRPE